MRKMQLLLAVVICFALLMGCAPKGEVENVKITLDDVDDGVESNYSEEELEKAVQVILDDFRDHYRDCTLTKLAYEGESTEILGRISFVGEFVTGDHPKNFEPNDEEKMWTWRLEKDESGEGWKIVSYGRG